MKLRFDANVLPMYFPDVHPPFAAYFEEVLDEVKLAEDLGFECFWFTEHHFLLYGGPIPNPAVFLAAAASRTSRIRLGSAISIIPLRHPLQTAEDYAMVDAVSGGRLDFGAGRGNVQLDFDVYEIDREESRARFEEGMEVIAKAWSSDRVSHHGRFWHFEDVGVYPRPAQQPMPNIWVAANSPESGTWAGERGYDLMTIAHIRTPDDVRQGVNAWKAALAKRPNSQRQHRCQLMLRVCIDENADTAYEMAQSAMRRWDALASRGRSHESAPRSDPAEMMARGRQIYGNPEQCIEGIHSAMKNFEFDTLAMVFNWGGLPHDRVMRSMKVFARDVIPAFSR
ncbi:MAG TPA: LLM class flavin-dependent oxidoreductase [Chloroflexota bacterium]|nr:LLM class flavin-dependent oxidoreductase [Chloroflexota bacterium]